MAKRIFRILDSLSPSEAKLTNIARKADGLHNLFFNEFGQLEKRKGYLKYNTTSLSATKRIAGLHRFYKQDTGTKEFLCVCDTKWFKLASSDPWAGTALYSTGTTDFTTTSDMDTFFVNYYDHCYGVNTKGLWKYGGSFVRTVGITAPAAPTFASFQTDGALGTGDYYFKVTYVDEDGYESNGSSASSVMTTSGADDAITINIPTSSDAKVPSATGKRKIYRTAVGGAIYYYDGVVNDNSTTTYKSDGADGALGDILHTNHTAPPSTPRLIAKRRTMLILADDDTFYWSHSGDPEYFPAKWIILTSARQKITGILEQKEYMPVYTSDTIERLVGTDKDNFEFKNTYSGEGCIAPRSLVSCNNLHLYLGVDGIYQFTGFESKIISPPLAEYIKDNINPTFAHLSASIFYNNQYLLSYPKDDSETNDETVYIDFETGTTGIYNFGFGCYSKWDRGTDGLQLYSGSATVGRVYKTLSGLEDDTAAIVCYDRTEPIDLGKPDTYKQWYDIYIKVKSTTGTALTMYYTLDEATETSASLTLTADKTRWYRIKLVQGGQRARAISLRPYVSDKYDITIMGYALSYTEEPAEWLR